MGIETRHWRLLGLLAWILLVSGLSGTAPASSGPWILIDSTHRTLSVMQDGRDPLEVFDNVAFGRGGVAAFRRSGDGVTPTGEFKVAWVNPDSRYHLFIGLDYPRPPHAEEALRRHVIDAETYVDIREAHLKRRLPPQDTELGGEIGIHGVGNHDPDIHRLFDWTMGCVAMTDRQIDALAEWVRIGMKVVIR